MENEPIWIPVAFTEDELSATRIIVKHFLLAAFPQRDVPPEERDIVPVLESVLAKLEMVEQVIYSEGR